MLFTKTAFCQLGINVHLAFIRAVASMRQDEALVSSRFYAEMNNDSQKAFTTGG